jgi:ribosomal protein S18 acetylase RimI-like enzyme
VSADHALRIGRAYREVASRRARHAIGGEIVELDGIVMAFTNLADDAQNGGFVVGEPRDAAAVVAAAEAEAARRGHALGLEVERGRFPAVERALEGTGLFRLLSRPAMSVDPAIVGARDGPRGLRVERVDDDARLRAIAAIEAAAFGTDPEVAMGLVRAIVADPETRVFLGTLDGVPAAEAIATRHEGTVGIFGIGVRAENRRHGIGAAMTVAAVRAFPDVDLAWLLPTPDAERLYEGLGFDTVSSWDVWVRGRSPAASR